MPHYTTTFGNGYHYQGRGSSLQQTDTFEFADKIGTNTEDPAGQTPTASNAPKAPETGDSFFYADPPQGEGPDAPSAEMGDDFVI